MPNGADICPPRSEIGNCLAPLGFNSFRMRQAGRVNIVVVGAIVAIAMIATVLLFSRQSVTEVASRFMSGLATGDVETLTKLTYLSEVPEDEVRKKWDFAVNEAGKYYRFRWQVLSAKENDDKTAAVRMYVWRNADSPASYEENFQLPLIKVDGQWKVDVRAISRDMYPGLPR